MRLRLLRSGERCILDVGQRSLMLLYAVPDISHTMSYGSRWGIEHDTYRKGVDSAEEDSEGGRLKTAHQLVI